MATRIHPLLQRLARRNVLVTDGGWATVLLTRGLKAGACPELLNLEQPALVEEIARGYLEAGADLVHTNTLGGSPERLAGFAAAERTEEINAAAVRLVRGVVGARAFVAGCCGPSGRMGAGAATDEADATRASYRRQMESLIDAGVDCLSIESLASLDEMRLAIEAGRALDAGVPILASMTFRPTPRGAYTILGVDVARAARTMEEAGADVIGANCGTGTQGMLDLAHTLRDCTALPLLVRPSAGLPQTRAGLASYPVAPAELAALAKHLIAAGVSIIGGCCGTAPEHVRALRRVTDAQPRLLHAVRLRQGQAAEAGPVGVGLWNRLWQAVTGK